GRLLRRLHRRAPPGRRRARGRGDRAPARDRRRGGGARAARREPAPDPRRGRRALSLVADLGDGARKRGMADSRGMSPLTIAPDRLERLRAICLALPEATEKIAWGDPTWRVRDKIFAMQKGNYEGGRPSVWLKV